MARKSKYDESQYQRIEQYIESNCTLKLSDEDAEYLNMLSLMQSMYRKYGQTNTLKFFQKEPYNMSYYTANEIFYESINLFYANENVS